MEEKYIKLVEEIAGGKESGAVAARAPSAIQPNSDLNKAFTLRPTAPSRALPFAALRRLTQSLANKPRLPTALIAPADAAMPAHGHACEAMSTM
jgi:hypothetical protein